MFESYCRHHLYRGVEERFLNRLITWSTRVRIPPPPDSYISVDTLDFYR